MDEFEKMDEEITIKTNVVTDGMGTATAASVSDNDVAALLAQMQEDLAMESTAALPDQGVKAPVQKERVGVTGVSTKAEDEMEARLAALRAV